MINPVKVVKEASSRILDYQPSCVEFCKAFPGVFVVGSYQLDEDNAATKEQDDGNTARHESQIRSGKLSVFKLQSDLTVQLLHTSQVEAGVLDLHFSPHEPDILAVGLSNGVVQLKRIVADSGHPLLCDLSSQWLCDALILALAWNPNEGRTPRLAITTSDGCYATIVFSEDKTSISFQCKIQSAHTLEAWTLAWPSERRESDQQHTPDEPTSDYLYTGGDDAVLCQWDLNNLGRDSDSGEERLPADIELERHIVQKGVSARAGLRADRRTHEAGVTAILPLPILQNGSDVLLAGSYDEHVRVMAVTNGIRWKTLAESHLRGGVWRLKMFSKVHDIAGAVAWEVLASCMHAGCKILAVIRDEDGSWSIQTLASFEGHGSMNYGSDAFLLPKAEDRPSRRVVVSSSFYDKKLCVWTPDEG